LRIKDETSTKEWEALLLAVGREGAAGLTKWETASGERKETGG